MGIALSPTAWVCTMGCACSWAWSFPEVCGVAGHTEHAADADGASSRSLRSCPISSGCSRPNRRRRAAGRQRYPVVLCSGDRNVRITRQANHRGDLALGQTGFDDGRGAAGTVLLFLSDGGLMDPICEPGHRHNDCKRAAVRGRAPGSPCEIGRVRRGDRSSQRSADRGGDAQSDACHTRESHTPARSAALRLGVTRYVCASLSWHPLRFHGDAACSGTRFVTWL
mmetsp:Transcript_67012/g.111359  ORF Transcript_67012/g.111359 Transcript_67012/m.111359 type:complete len:225 (-) Transcript_67012:1238-1912(-)